MSKRYVPNLIPEEYRVLKHYFKGHIYGNSKPHEIWIIFNWIVGICFFLTSLRWIMHPILFVLFGCIGYMIIPVGHNFLERRLRFRFTNKIKGTLVALLIILSFPFISHYTKADEMEIIERRKEQEVARLRIQYEQDSIEQRRKQFKDSLNGYIAFSENLGKNGKLDEAIDKLKRATVFAIDSTDTSRILLLQNNILAEKVSMIVNSGKYQQAIPELNELIKNNQGNSNFFYQRALCYSKTGSILQAVEDCRTAIGLGNEKAEKLHNKINPIRRRIIDYVTRCCDGTTSSAKGRGACSHHHGVCDWNEPVYEESRKY